MTGASRLVVDGQSLARRQARVAHANAQRSWNVREGVVLSLRAGSAVGRGEASPLPGYSQDDLEVAVAELGTVAARLGPIDVAADVRATLRAAKAQTGLRSPSATFALETAVLDLIAQARRLPAWVALRGDDAAREVPLNGLAEGASTDALVASIEAAIARGLRVVKVKVGAGGDVARDVERLTAVRAAFGDALVLRFDANQVLPAVALQGALDALAPFRPELLEEPSSPEVLDALPASPVPLALDESLVRDDAESRIASLAGRGLLRAVVLKPMALGGFDRCLALAEAAARAGLGVVLSHMFDGPVAAAASACLALAVRGPVLACGLDVHGRFGDGGEHELRLSAYTPTFVRPFEETGLGLSQNG